MHNFKKVREHQFFRNVIEADTQPIILKLDSTPDYVTDDLECYIYTVGYYSSHLLGLFEQLDLAVKLITNLSDKFSVIDQIHYNIENYIIRTVSLSDRILQIINAVYDLKNDEKDVKYTKIIKQIKEIKDDVILKNIESFENTLKDNDYKDKRNTILHRRMSEDDELRYLKPYYDYCDKELLIKENKQEAKKLERHMKEKLNVYIEKKQEEFNKISDKLFERILPLLDNLLNKYSAMKHEIQ